MTYIGEERKVNIKSSTSENDSRNWIPACAGMTGSKHSRTDCCARMTRLRYFRSNCLAGKISMLNFRCKIVIITNIYVILACIFFPSYCYGAEAPHFDAESAWGYLVAQCDFGPRNPGSKGHSACQDYLAAELEKLGGEVRLQPFTHYDRRLGITFFMNNIIADFGDSGERKIILCAHWDTRPRSDMDPIPANREKPILGASDGASGVAILLEMARLFSIYPPPAPVQIILFDGEDYGRAGENWDYLLGSKHWNKTAEPDEYRFGILLDIVGHTDLEIKREYNSYQYCRDLQDKLWRIAEEVGSYQFSNRMTTPIIDDHLSLIEIGIPAVDIIDLGFKYWHTQGDTPEHCCPESLEAVGNVLVELIYNRLEE